MFPKKFEELLNIFWGDLRLRMKRFSENYKKLGILSQNNI